MDITSETDLERLASVIKGLANETRVALLLGLYEGKDQDDLVEILPMTRGGIHKHLERLRETELVYRRKGTEYALTPIGIYWARLLDRDGVTLLKALDELEEAEEPVSQEVESMKQSIEDKEDEGFNIHIDDVTWERTLHTEKWKRAMDEINDILDLPDDERPGAS